VRRIKQRLVLTRARGGPIIRIRRARRQPAAPEPEPDTTAATDTPSDPAGAAEAPVDAVPEQPEQPEQLAQPAQPEQPPAEESSQGLGDHRPRLRGLRTTGLFTVPADTVMQLVVAISSLSEDHHTADLWIRRVDGARRDTIFFRSLEVPAHSVQRVTVDGLSGQTVEIDVHLSSDLLVPTAAVTQFFPADGATVVALYKSAGDFILV